jgi:hypothetical protein
LSELTTPHTEQHQPLATTSLYLVVTFNRITDHTGNAVATRRITAKSRLPTRTLGRRQSASPTHIAAISSGLRRSANPPLPPARRHFRPALEASAFQDGQERAVFYEEAQTHARLEEVKGLRQTLKALRDKTQLAEQLPTAGITDTPTPPG